MDQLNEPPRWATAIFQTICWIVSFAVIFLTLCGLRSLWDQFTFGA